MKKLIALLLAALMTFSLVGCASGPELLGKYETTIDLTDMIIAEFDSGTGLNDPNLSLANYLDKFEIKVLFEFKEDGTHVQMFDTASLEDSMETFKAAIVPLMDDLLLFSLDQTLGAMGYTIETKEDVEAILNMNWDDIFVQSMGITAEDFIGQMVDELSAELFDQTVLAEGKYKAENGKLHISLSLDEEYLEDAYETYEIDGDTVTITGGVNIEEDEILPYPYTLTKIS